MELDVHTTSKAGRQTCLVVSFRCTLRFALALVALVSAATGLSTSTIVELVTR